MIDKTYSSNVVAITDCTIKYFTKDIYIDWLKKDFDFSIYINKQLSTKIYLSSEKSSMNILYPLEYCLLKMIWNLLDKNIYNHEVFIPKSDLAESIGTSVRSLNRLLKDLDKKQILTMKKNTISIISIEKFIEEMKNYE